MNHLPRKTGKVVDELAFATSELGYASELTQGGGAVTLEANSRWDGSPPRRPKPARYVLPRYRS